MRHSDDNGIWEIDYQENGVVVSVLVEPSQSWKDKLPKASELLFNDGRSMRTGVLEVEKLGD